MLKSVQQALSCSDILIIVSHPLANVPVELPLQLYESGYTKDNNTSILITNPSNEKVKELAARASKNTKIRSTELGRTVGFSLPFMSVTSSTTYIEYVSDAIAVHELTVDPFLKARSLVMVDDVHLRGKWTDVLLSLIKSVMTYEKGQTSKTRKNDLKLIINVSATCLQLVDQIVDFFSEKEIGIKVMELEAFKTCPVDTYYLDAPTSNFVEKTIESIITVFDETYFAYPKLYHQGGDVIAFLPTKSDVVAVLKKIANEIHHLDSYKKIRHPPEIVFYSFHEDTKPDDLLQLRKPVPMNESDTAFWRVIVATSVAENDYQLLNTGRICSVIDSGFDSIRLPAFNKQKIFLRTISKSKSEIRRSMAGNNKLGHTGKCFRLYSNDDAKEMPSNEVPELSVLLHLEQEYSFMTSVLADIFLLLISLKIKSISTRFEFLPPLNISSETPNGFISAFNKTYMYLFFMGCVDSNCNMTSAGILMSRLSFVPIPFALSVIASAGYKLSHSPFQTTGNCLHEMVTITAMFLAGGLSTIFISPESKEERELAIRMHQKFQVFEGDAITLLNVYETYQQKGGAGAPKIGKWAAENYLNYRALLRAEGIRTQILRYIQSMSLPQVSTQLTKESITERLCKCICQGFFLNAAKKSSVSESFDDFNFEKLSKGDFGIRYELINEEKTNSDDTLLVKAHDSSVGNDPNFVKGVSWIVYTSLVERRNNQWVIEGVTAVKKEWLTSSNFYQEGD